MPFPFLPAGLLVAASFLVAVLTAFGLILRAMNRAVVGIRDTVLSGLVSGFRKWSSGQPGTLIAESPRASGSPWSGSSASARASSRGAVVTPPTDDGVPTGSSVIGSSEKPELIDLGSESIETAGRRRR
jgi:hypothetical protein